MSSGKSSIVLFHGVTMSSAAWEDVVPFLSDHHDVVALTALGHRGGPVARQRPVEVRDLVDEAERMLDDRGIAQAHLAGNSLGGWMAIELALRGRALSVCALSPAGFWDGGGHGQTAAVRKLRRIGTLVRATRRVHPLALRSAVVRRLSMRDVACRADRLTPTQALTATADLIGCTVTEDLLGTAEQIAPVSELPCPITLAWSAKDAILPPKVNGRIAQERFPRARFEILPGVGHVPMIDDPKLVATTILATTGAVPATTGVRSASPDADR
ncbi:alpha/beta fold hydrolase [Nocardia alba]|uniref:Pimeloyl-ACP methyl ester carboxylesterase n=1 Tax=Nocardia alba TaxID=225051 RepID=A0A4R1FUJ1_9NOCA|nr:alpha/beta hydrolase [Nocardia alba]TCJ97474.1 pimeloyl-ACP methyl ester carboxylesterase [Nocardia alba]